MPDTTYSNNDTLDPLPHQAKAAALAPRKNLLIADDCGMGKTFTSILCAQTVAQTSTGKGRPVLVLCNHSAIGQWVEECQKAGVPVRAFGRREKLPKQYMYYVTNYETLYHDPTMKMLRSHYFGSIIGDEAHRFKNRKTKTAKRVKSLKAFRRFALSATPMERGPQDLWSILHWLYPHHFTSYWFFVDEFVEVETNWAGYRVLGGPKNLPRLQSKLKPFYMRHTREEVGMLPSKNSRIPVAMTPGQKKAYDLIENADDLLVEGFDDRDPMFINGILARITRLQQVLSHPPMLQIDEPSAKCNWVVEFVEANPDEPVLVFTRFRHTASYLADKLDASLLMGGSAPFNKGSQRVVATIDAGGESLSMPHMRTCIFVDHMNSTLKTSQATDRINRLNSEHPLRYVIQLYCPKTVDQDILDNLETKGGNIELVHRYLENIRSKN